MGLFGDKKKGFESLKTLSEKEIQSKLYGHLRKSDRIIQEDLPSLSKPRQETQTVYKSSEATKTLTPSVSSPVKTTAPDLFKPQEFRPDAPAVSRRTEEEVSIKNTDLKPSVTAKIYTDKYAKPHETKSNIFTKTSSGIGGALLQTVKQIGFKSVEVLGTAISGILRLFASLDFRKPAVRKFFYAVLTIAVLAFIFIGIHHLNKNREIAMKTPGKKLSAQKKKEKSSNPSQPLTAALTASNSNNAPATVSATSVAETALAKAEKKTEGIPVKSETKITTPISAKAEAKKTSSPAVEVPGYVIQVATFATQDDAGRLVQKFQAAGFSSFFKSVARSGGRVYYCVFIGKFATHQDADDKLSEFKKQEVAKPFQDAFVRSV